MRRLLACAVRTTCLTAFLCVVTFNAGLARADVVTSVDASALPGVWRYVKEGLFASGTVITWLNRDHSCQQVIRASVFGSEHWKWLACQWQLVDGALQLTVVDSNSETAPAGKVLRFPLQDVGGKVLRYGSQDDSTEWRRADSVSDDFLTRRAKAVSVTRQARGG